MNQKSSIILFFLLFIICFSSCNEESLEEKGNSNVTVSKIKLSDKKVVNNLYLMKQINKVKTPKELLKNQVKMVYDSINNFSFDDENGTLIQTADGYESYTFPIVRTTTNEYELENIVFTKSGSEFEGALIKYNLNQEEINELEAGNSFTPEITPDIDILSKLTVACNIE